MDKELEQDLIDWFESHMDDTQELILEYFQRVLSHRGLNDHGFSDEKISVDELCDFYFHKNGLSVALQQICVLHSKFFLFRDAYESASSLVAMADHKDAPCIKDGFVWNVYSVPVKELYKLFSSIKKQRGVEGRLKISVGKDSAVFFTESKQDVLYKPTKGLLPAGIVNLLTVSHNESPVRSSFIAKEVVVRERNKVFTPNDITTAIQQINNQFRRKTDVDLIINRGSGYFFNRDQMDIEIIQS